MQKHDHKNDDDSDCEVEDNFDQATLEEEKEINIDDFFQVINQIKT